MQVNSVRVDHSSKNQGNDDASIETPFPAGCKSSSLNGLVNQNGLVHHQPTRNESDSVRQLNQPAWRNVSIAHFNQHPGFFAIANARTGTDMAWPQHFGHPRWIDRVVLSVIH